MKKILILALSLISLSALAQQSDTLYSYTNIGGKDVKKLEKAVAVYKIYKGENSSWIKTTSDKNLVLLKKETFADEKLHILNGPYFEYQNGKTSLSGFYLEGSKTGIWTRYYQEGNPMEVQTFTSNLLNGSYSSFYLNGKKIEEGAYVNGKMEGDWNLYNEEGQLKSIKVFKDGVLNENDERQNKLLNVAPPKFPGGMKMFYNYLGRSIRYPREALESKIIGKVYFLITIDKEGKTKDFKVIYSPGQSLTDEARRVALGSPKWMPATEDGKSVDMIQTLSINFSMN